jgi:hypothetical protein
MSKSRATIKKGAFPQREAPRNYLDRNGKDYSLASAFFASSAFFAHAAQGFSAVQPSHFFSAVQHAAFSAALSLHPQVSQANAMEPAIINAIAAILIIFFMLDLLSVNFPNFEVKDQTGLISYTKYNQIIGIVTNNLVSYRARL